MSFQFQCHSFKCTLTFSHYTLHRHIPRVAGPSFIILEWTLQVPLGDAEVSERSSLISSTSETTWAHCPTGCFVCGLDRERQSHNAKVTSLLLASSESQEQWPFFLKPSFHLASHALVGGRDMREPQEPDVWVGSGAAQFWFWNRGCIASSVGPL